MFFARSSSFCQNLQLASHDLAYKWQKICQKYKYNFLISVRTHFTEEAAQGDALRYECYEDLEGGPDGAEAHPLEGEARVALHEQHHQLLQGGQKHTVHLLHLRYNTRQRLDEAWQASQTLFYYVFLAEMEKCTLS